MIRFLLTWHDDLTIVTPTWGRLELKVGCDEVVESASINLWKQICLESVASSFRVQHSTMCVGMM